MNLGIDDFKEFWVDMVAVLIRGKLYLIGSNEPGVDSSTEDGLDDIFLIFHEDDLLWVVYIGQSVSFHLVDLHLTTHEIDDGSCTNDLIFQI